MLDGGGACLSVCPSVCMIRGCAYACGVGMHVCVPVNDNLSIVHLAGMCRCTYYQTMAARTGRNEMHLKMIMKVHIQP